MKRFWSFLLVMCMTIALLPATVVSAAQKTSAIYDGYYYIEHVKSSRYLEIDPESYDEAEESVRLWRKKDNRQTQVFYLMNTTKGWIIKSYSSGKVTEVEDASTKTNAAIVQNDDAGTQNQRWTLVYNTDGTVSIRNKKSGMYMSAPANAKNGTEMIQSISQDKYNMYRLEYSDVMSAKWTRKLSESEITWSTDGSSQVKNLTGWSHSKSGYYPTPGNTYLMEVEYIIPEVVEQMVKMRQSLPQYWEDIKKALDGKLSEDEIKELLLEMGLEDIPYIDYGIGVLKVIWNNRDNNQWAKFLQAASPDRYGKCKGLIVYNYDTVTERGEYTSSGWQKVIETVDMYVFESWDGTNLQDVEYKPVNQTGTWRYIFY